MKNGKHKHPSLYFCDFDGELADAVREGRRKEFASFPEFSKPEAREQIPDPNSEDTFRKSCLNWQELEQTNFKASLAFSQKMLQVRRASIWPLLKTRWVKNTFHIADNLLKVEWQFETAQLTLFANFSDKDMTSTAPEGATQIWGALGDHLPAWKSSWYVGPRHV